MTPEVLSVGPLSGPPRWRRTRDGGAKAACGLIEIEIRALSSGSRWLSVVRLGTSVLTAEEWLPAGAELGRALFHADRLEAAKREALALATARWKHLVSGSTGPIFARARELAS